MIRIQELASVLVDRYGLGKDDAEQFVAQMFQLVTDELNASQKSVKIKGLGTFKVTSVNSRESVDVNTGDRIVISGRNKISFVPDVVMRDRVNRPFAQFETVVVNDGVDFSEIDNMSDAEQLGKNVGEEASATVGSEEIAAGNDNAEASDSAVDSSANVGGGSDEGNEGQADGMDNSSSTVDDSSDDGKDETVSNLAAVDNDGGQDAPDVVSSGEKEASVEEKEGVSPSAGVLDVIGGVENVGSEEPKPKGKRTLFWGILILLVVILVAGGCGIYYMYGLVQQRNAKIELLEQRMKQAAPAAKNAVKPIANSDSLRNKQNDADSKAIAAETVKADSAVENAAHNKSDDNVPEIDYSSDPRLRTGAYIIIGVEKTVEVRKGQTLESISKAYLGNGMECYVEALNSRKEVNAGDKLKIPKLKLKRRSK